METKNNLHELLMIFSEAVFVDSFEGHGYEWLKDPNYDETHEFVFHYRTEHDNYYIRVADIECDNLPRRAYLLVQDAKALLTLKLLEEVIY